VGRLESWFNKRGLHPFYILLRLGEEFKCATPDMPTCEGGGGMFAFILLVWNICKQIEGK
jgi:hypothetical protein